MRWDAVRPFGGQDGGACHLAPLLLPARRLNQDLALSRPHQPAQLGPGRPLGQDPGQGVLEQTVLFKTTESFVRKERLHPFQKHIFFYPGYEFCHLSDECFNQTFISLVSYPGVDARDTRATLFAAKAHDSDEIPGLVLLPLHILLCYKSTGSKV